MKRASSASALRIEFDPREAKVGHSSIDKLPIKRYHSTKSLSKVSSKQHLVEAAVQNHQYHIDLLERMNKSLQKENEFLKKQLQCYTNSCSSRRPSITSSRKHEQRDKILNRLDSKPDKNDTESTGLFNSKISSGRKHADDSIAELYEKFTLKALLPKPQILFEIVKGYQSELKDNYMKIKSMVQKLKMGDRYKEGETIKQIQKIVNLLEWSVLNQGNSNNPTKPPVRPGKPNKDQLMEDFFSEFSSQNETLAIFQLMLGKICKSGKVLEKVKSSLGFVRFIRKINRLE